MLSGPSERAFGGELSAETDITLAGINVHEGLLELELPQGGQGDEAEAIVFRPAQDQRLFGLSLGAPRRCGSATATTADTTRCSASSSTCRTCSATGPGRTPAG